MPPTADELIRAIMGGDLDTEVKTELDRFAIATLVDGEEVARVGCLFRERPKSNLTTDGRCVEVFPSPGLPDGFEITCDTTDDAETIAESLDGLLAISYLDLIEPDR